ncbi:MAG: cysteine dioxygenase [Acidobacteriota bacterium]
MKAADMTLGQFIEKLNEFAVEDFPVREVHRFFQDVSFAPGELERYEFYRDGQYTRNLIHKSKEFELLLICWSPGQAAPAHGHEGEKCWARVERGKLRFTNYFEKSSAGSVTLDVLSTEVGEPHYLDGPADIHSVENPFDESAVTLHLYSHPYEACDIYDLPNQRKERTTLSYYSTFGEIPRSVDKKTP